MSIVQLINKIKLNDSCIVYPARGLPQLEKGYKLPEDVKQFYSLCGGMKLYHDSDYAVSIVPPDEFVPANPIIVGERFKEDMSSDWHIIANSGSGEYLTIDLNDTRLGRCYDSFIDRHGVVGESSIIAMSFFDLLNRLFANKGNYWYWLNPQFVSLGDAYDDV